MSVALIVNGVTYNYPSPGDVGGWGQQATQWASAVTSSIIPRAGGSFPLSGELDFSNIAGLRTLWVRSETVNPSTTGVLRLANLDNISWRNAGNTADLPLTVNGLDQLTFNGNVIVTAGTDVTSFNGRTGVVTLTSSDVTTALGFAPVQTFNTRTGAVTLTSSDVTTALTFTPYNATNPSGYITNSGVAITSGSINNTSIGATTATTGQFTTVTSTVSTGTAPFTVASTTNVANLNASSLSGATFASPGPIGSGTPSTGAFTTASATTFTGALSGNATTATTATNANNVAITSTSTNANFNITFVSTTSGNLPLDVNSNITFNPSIQTLSVPTIVCSSVSGHLIGVADAATTTNGYGAPVSNITVTASPFVYKNTTSYESSVIVNGGVVTLIEFSRDGSTYYTLGITAGMFQLSINDYVRVTYSSAPTMSLVAR